MEFLPLFKLIGIRNNVNIYFENKIIYYIFNDKNLIYEIFTNSMNLIPNFKQKKMDNIRNFL